MTHIDEIIAFHEIGQLKYRYLRALDTQQWDLMETCFTEDASVWYNDGKYQKSGRREILAFLQSLLNSSTTSSHIVTHPEIELINPSKAKGIWRLQDIVHFLDKNPAFAHANIQGGEEMMGAGYYYDEYVRQANGWKISRMGYVRIFESINSRDHRPGFRLEVDPARGISKI